MLKPITLRFHVKNIPRGIRVTQYIVAITTITTAGSMLLLAVTSILANNAEFRQQHGLSPSNVSKNDLSSPTTPQPIDNASTATPVISLSTDKQTVTTGEKATLTWSVTENPSLCVAGDDWSGEKKPSGTETTNALDKEQTYLYTLTCSTTTQTSFASTSIVVTTSATPVINPPTTGSGDVATRPHVSLSLSTKVITTGSSAILTWNVTGSPTSCTAGGSWSGTKAASGSQTTGVISSAGTKSYTLTCSNSAGSETATIILTATAAAPTLPRPTINFSATPAAITAGSSAILTWNVTGSPTSCTAGGSWSGTKAASGSQTTGVISSAGTKSYTLTCSNSAGSVTASTSVTVNPAPLYCGGKTPCYGRSDLAAHATIGNCWGWNLDWVINITTYRPVHKGGMLSGSSSTLENTSATCNHDISSILKGTAAIPGYKDKRSNTTFGHSSNTINNTASSTLIGYRVGYYDASKP